MINITLPDGNIKAFDQAISGLRRGPEHLRGAGPQLRRHGTGRPPGGPEHAHRARRARSGWSPPRTRKRCEIMRHSAAHVMAQAILRLYPEAKLTIGPVVEDGFYYDIDMPPVSEEDFPAHRGRDPEDRQGQAPHPAARGDQGGGAGVLPERALQAGDDPGPAGRHHFALRAGRVHRPLPRAARAPHRVRQGHQAAEGLRRLLARRPGPRPAAAHLRHGLFRQEGARRLPARSWRRPSAATTARSARPWTCSAFTTRRPACPFSIPRAWSSGTRCSTTGAASTARPATWRPRPRSCSTARSGSARGHWENYRENMYTTIDRRDGVRHQAHELPRRHAALQPQAAFLPGPAPAGGRNRPGAPPRAVRGALGAVPGAGLPPGRRPHLHDPGSDRAGDPGRAAAGGAHLRHLRPGVPPGALHPAEEIDRHRRAVGAWPPTG